jgi:hypothetical protein
MTLAATVLATTAAFFAAAGAPPDQTVLAPTQIEELAAGENEGALRRVAFTTRCQAPRVWGLAGGIVTPLSGYSPCSSHQDGGVYGLSFGTWVAAWATYAGNPRRHSLWLAFHRWPRWRAPTRVAIVAESIRGPTPFVVGEGRQNSVSYALGRRVYRAGSYGRRFLWEAPARPLSLSASLGRVAVRRADGPVTVVTDYGVDRSYAYAPGEALATKLYGEYLVVLRRRALDWYGLVGKRDTLPLPAARSYGDGYCGVRRCVRASLRLEDLDRDLVVYVLGREVHVLRLTDRVDVVVRRPVGGPVEAQLEGSGLAYSSGRSVFWVPRREIDRLLARGQ